MATWSSIYLSHFVEQVLELESTFLAAASLPWPVTAPPNFLPVLTFRCIVWEKQSGAQGPASSATDELVRKGWWVSKRSSCQMKTEIDILKLHFNAGIPI